MEEPPGGENFGYRRNGNGMGESLNYRDWAPTEQLIAGGWTCANHVRSGCPRGRPKTIQAEWLTPAGIAAVEQRLGFTCEDFRRVVRKGRLRSEDRVLRATIARRLRESVDAGAVVAALADVLGCSPQTLWRLVRK
jgi:hypothetical protein